MGDGVAGSARPGASGTASAATSGRDRPARRGAPGRPRRGDGGQRLGVALPRLHRLAALDPAEEVPGGVEPVAADALGVAHEPRAQARHGGLVEPSRTRSPERLPGGPGGVERGGVERGPQGRVTRGRSSRHHLPHGDLRVAQVVAPAHRARDTARRAARRRARRRAPRWRRAVASSPGVRATASSVRSGRAEDVLRGEAARPRAGRSASAAGRGAAGSWSSPGGGLGHRGADGPLVHRSCHDPASHFAPGSGARGRRAPRRAPAPRSPRACRSRSARAGCRRGARRR